MATTHTACLVLALTATLLACACARSQGTQAPAAQASTPGAGVDQNLATCSDIGLDAASRIAACTAVIDDGDANPHVRAIALNNRGVDRSQQGDKDGAIADFTAAIGLNPNYDAAFYNRAKAWRDKGEVARADADAAEAVRLNPALKGR